MPGPASERGATFRLAERNMDTAAVRDAGNAFAKTQASKEAEAPPYEPSLSVVQFGFSPEIRPDLSGLEDRLPNIHAKQYRRHAGVTAYLNLRDETSVFASPCIVEIRCTGDPTKLLPLTQAVWDVASPSPNSARVKLYRASQRAVRERLRSARSTDTLDELVEREETPLMFAVRRADGGKRRVKNFGVEGDFAFMTSDDPIAVASIADVQGELLQEIQEMKRFDTGRKYLGY